MTETALREAFRRARRPESFGLDARVMALDRKILALTLEREALLRKQIEAEPA